MELIKKSSWIIGIIGGILIGLALKKNLFEKLELIIFKFSIGDFIIVCAATICFLITIFIIDANKKPENQSSHSLGLPAGSVRAILALVLIVFFMLISFYVMLSETNVSNERMVENIMTTLATLVISVISFYFGSKATEQGSDIASKIWGDREKKSNQDLDPKIIQEALTQNKTKWMVYYGCRDIRLGKKQTSDGQVNLDCLIFFVDLKMEPSTLGVGSTNSIPPTIAFEFQDKSYSIPTDVRLYSETEGQQYEGNTLTSENAFLKLGSEDQKSIIAEFIRVNSEDLRKNFAEIKEISAFQKIIAGIHQPYYSIQFKVGFKAPNNSSIKQIPPFFEVNYGIGKKYLIPTDVIEEESSSEIAWNGTEIVRGKISISTILENIQIQHVEYTAVTLISSTSDLVKYTNPNKEGFYSIDNVPIGKYSLEAELVIEKSKYFAKKDILIKNDGNYNEMNLDLKPGELISKQD